MSNVFFIAEAGVNHDGCADLALKMCKIAKESGASAIKFQTYKATSLASKKSPAYWDQNCEPTSSQFELFRKHECFDIEFYKPLIKYCSLNNLEFMTTVLDEE